MPRTTFSVLSPAWITQNINKHLNAAKNYFYFFRKTSFKYFPV